MNHGKIEVPNSKGGVKKLSSFIEYLEFRGLSKDLNNLRPTKRKG